MTKPAPDSQPGPRVLSVYDGFFSGGARILHTDVVRDLHTTTDQVHSVLSLHDRVYRERTIQPMENDTCYKRLSAAGIAIQALNRQSRPGAAAPPVTLEDLTIVQQAVDANDIVLSLKEQPLSVLEHIDLHDKPLFVSLHRSDPEHQGSGVESLRTMYEMGRLTAAICCATSTQHAYHEATGIPIENLPVIPNGVDLRKFKPSIQERSATREHLGIVGDAPVILFAARFDEMKNVPLFVKAAASFVGEQPDAHFIMCGAGMSDKNNQLTTLLTEHLGGWERASDNVHILGIRSDMPSLYASADIVALTSSYGEAAPLSLLEGMASGAIPVTTNVGDSAAIVRIPELVTTDDPDNIAATWKKAYESRDHYQHRMLRIRQKLSSEQTFDKYTQLINGAYQTTS